MEERRRKNWKKEEGRGRIKEAKGEKMRGERRKKGGGEKEEEKRTRKREEIRRKKEVEKEQ